MAPKLFEKRDELRLRTLYRLLYERLPEAKKHNVWYKVLNPANILLFALAIPAMISNLFVGLDADILGLSFFSIAFQGFAVLVFLVMPKFEKIAVRALALFLLGYYIYVFLVHPDATLIQTLNIFLYPSFVYVTAGYIEALMWSFVSIMIFTSTAVYNYSIEATGALSANQILVFVAAFVSMIFFIHVIDMLAKITTVDLRRQKGELEASNAQYDTVLNSVGDGLIATDKKGRVQFSSQSALGLLGLSRGDLYGRPFFGSVFLLDDEDNIVRAADHPLQKVIESGEPLVINRASEKRYKLMRDDRTTFPANLTISPIKLMGELTGVIILFHDSTQEDQIDHAKSEFVSLASHQLRTPLNVVSWYTEKLQKGKGGTLNAKGKDYVNEIRTSNFRMIELVSSILNVSRIELGRLKIKEQPVDIIALTKLLVQEVAPLAEKANIEIKQKYFADEFVLENSDNEHVTVIVQNLLSNAVKYTEDDGAVQVVLAKVKAGQTLNSKFNIIADEPGVVLKVSDSGIGIPLEQQDQIFGKLFRADNAQALAVNGTGLGLYVTKSLAEELHGAVWFKSVPDEGTTFSVYLPQKTAFSGDKSVLADFHAQKHR